MIMYSKCCKICKRNYKCQSESMSRCRHQIQLDRIYISHHSNNRTIVLPTFQVHNLLTGTLLLFVVNVFLITKTFKKYKTLNTHFYLFFCNKNVKTETLFLHLWFSVIYVSTLCYFINELRHIDQRYIARERFVEHKLNFGRTNKNHTTTTVCFELCT